MLCCLFDFFPYQFHKAPAATPTHGSHFCSFLYGMVEFLIAYQLSDNPARMKNRRWSRVRHFSALRSGTRCSELFEFDYTDELPRALNLRIARRCPKRAASSGIASQQHLPTRTAPTAKRRKNNCTAANTSGRWMYSLPKTQIAIPCQPLHYVTFRGNSKQIMLRSFNHQFAEVGNVISNIRRLSTFFRHRRNYYPQTKENRHLRRNSISN